MSVKNLEKNLQLEAGYISNIFEKGVASFYREKTVQRARLRIDKSYDAPRVRKICVPQLELKVVQRRIAQMLSRSFVPHGIVHSYTKGRGIVSNAKIHVGKKSILYVDFADFFGSITHDAILCSLYTLFEEHDQSEIEAIARLCCLNGVLPQGSPASPILSNMVCFPLDAELWAIARMHRCSLSRYSDDIFFSSADARFPPLMARRQNSQVKLGKSLRAVFERHGFEVNAEKLRLAKRDERWKVTGLIVGDKLNVPKEFCRTIRAALHQWERGGVAAAARSHPKGTPDAFVASLKGRIEHVGQVRGQDDVIYRRFMMALETLCARG